MSTYQTYDFIKDVNFHIKNKSPIELNSKSNAFKNYLFKLKLFQLTDKITREHPLFNEKYFIFILYNILYVAKKLDNDPIKFDYIEVIHGIKLIRQMKLKKLFS